jgi:hypothetical protein
MVKNPIVGPKLRPFYTQSIMIRLVACLALWSGFKVNKLPDIEEGDGHYLHHLPRSRDPL